MTNLFQYSKKHDVSCCVDGTNTFGNSIEKQIKVFFDIMKTEELITCKTKSISFASMLYEYRRL